jgi:hypothetical protein
MRPSRLHLSLVALLALGAVACGGAAPPPDTAPRSGAAAAAARPRRVVLISLDGAGAADLHRYYEQGEFDRVRGLRRFFEDGVVAAGLVPVNPTLTSTNHASLATGALPSRTGIVSNTVHLPGTPLGEMVRGFDIPIDVETLWEAARRQGKRVAVATWPSVDWTDDRRSADYGFVFVNDPEHPARVVTLGPKVWGDSHHEDRTWTESHSPVRAAQVTIEGGDGAPLTYGLHAVDRSDDGAVNYDALEIRREVEDTSPERLAAGEWAELEDDPRFGGDDEGPAVRGVKLLELAPDLSRVRLYFGGSFRTRAYPHEHLVDMLRSGLRWPGAPDDDHLEAGWAGQPGIDLATWVEQARRFGDFYGSAWLSLAADDGWDLALLYLPMIDEAGHQLLLVSPEQAGYSRERMVAFDNARRAVWRVVDGVIARLYAGEVMADTAVVIVSDHGMAPIHSAFDPNVLLRREGLLATDDSGEVQAAGTTAWAANASTSAHVYLRQDLAGAARRALVARLARLFAEFASAGKRPVARVAPRHEMAALGLDHPRSGDLVLFAAPGWKLDNFLDGDEPVWPTGEGEYGAHGYLNDVPAMEAIYLALGPGIGRGRIGKVRNTEVAGKVAALLGIELGASAVTGTQ